MGLRWEGGGRGLGEEGEAGLGEKAHSRVPSSDAWGLGKRHMRKSKARKAG